MKKFFKRKDQVETARKEPDFLTLLQEIKQQLVSLEKKIDILTNQPQERHGGRSYGRDRSAGVGRFRERSFTKAVCAQCNKECEVPFKPAGDRPVYCKDCFSKREGGSFEGRRDTGSRSGGFAQERRSGRHFDKRRGGENQRFTKRKPVAFRGGKKEF